MTVGAPGTGSLRHPSPHFDVNLPQFTDPEPGATRAKLVRLDDCEAGPLTAIAGWR